MKSLTALTTGGRTFLPLVEGGKGISATNHVSAGAWARAGGLGTISAVNADSYDEDGNVIPQVYHERMRTKRHEELVAYGIKGAVEQVQRAYDIASDTLRAGRGALNINLLWEMGGAQRILEAVLDQTKGLLHGVTCGAGMPYKLAEIAASHGVYYYPIISSARAFRALWKRSYKNHAEWLGAVVYEDPWKAGGHNGLTNAENPLSPEDPFPRVLALREVMRKEGISDDTPIVVAGGVWYLRDWQDWIDNPDLGRIAFQFGTRPLLTRESPIPKAWKDRLRTLKPGDIKLHRYSPTGFYSSAVHNSFLRELEERSARQIPFSKEQTAEHGVPLEVGGKTSRLFVSPEDLERARDWHDAGFTEQMRTPDNTVIFVTDERKKSIQTDQRNCMGCLSHCVFSGWKDHGNHTTGHAPDPRSFCIQKTLQAISHGDDADNELMFAGASAFNFATDPFYADGFVPTVQQLIDRLQTGD